MSGPLRVLLVEDNDVFRETLELLFGLRSDIEVVAALADGAAAPEACRRLSPDVVVLDYRLPGLDGIDVARAIREASDVPVVCLTASATERELVELRGVGIAAIVRKDEPLDAIVAALRLAAGKLVA